MICCKIALTLFASLSPPADEPTLAFRPLIDAIPMGTHVVLVHASGTTLAPMASLVRVVPGGHPGWIVLPDTQGMPIVGMPARPHVFRTSYKGAQGYDHEIVTDCKHLSVANCAKAHKAAVNAYVKLFPRQQ